MTKRNPPDINYCPNCPPYSCIIKYRIGSKCKNVFDNVQTQFNKRKEKKFNPDVKGLAAYLTKFTRAAK